MNIRKPHRVDAPQQKAVESRSEAVYELRYDNAPCGPVPRIDWAEVRSTANVLLAAS